MKNVLPYVYDYISLLFEDNEARKLVRKIILFGSVARGEFDEKSDIDIFIEVSPGMAERAGDLTRKAEKRFSVVSGKKWLPMGIKNPIRAIAGSLEDPAWEELRSEMISSGITLYGKFEAMPPKMGHYSLFSYSLSGLQQKKKMKLLRGLFGYSMKKKEKTYRQTGMLGEIGGRKLGLNSALVPLEKSRDVQKFFSSFGITPEIREVWIKS